MKTTTRSLLYLALASATGSTLAQDPHAGLHGHEAATAPAPHAGHAPVAAQAAENDPHASHAPQHGAVG
ncbi:hypothetical protein, partial [Stenotrophomonas mori]